MSLDSPYSKNCIYCNSRKTSLKYVHSENSNHVSQYRHCQMCRRDFEIWSGTEFEAVKRRANMRGIANRMKKLS